MGKIRENRIPIENGTETQNKHNAMRLNRQDHLIVFTY